MGEESSKPNSSYTKDTIISDDLSEEATSLIASSAACDSTGTTFHLNMMLRTPSLNSLAAASRSTASNLAKSPAFYLSNLQSRIFTVACMEEQLELSPRGCQLPVPETVVGKDKELFLGELGISYVSAAPSNAEVVVDGSVVRSGRNITVVAVDFRVKDSGKLVYTSNATFYHMPVASL